MYDSNFKSWKKSMYDSNFKSWLYEFSSQLTSLLLDFNVQWSNQN